MSKWIMMKRIKKFLNQKSLTNARESPKHQSEVEYLKNISKKTDRIKNNLVFFFLLTVISILVYFLSSIFKFLI